MEATPLQQILINTGETYRCADVYFREDWGCFYFSLLGKCFGMMNESVITVKGNPEENIRLRAQYTDITPGYYANKIHWNSIKLDTQQLSLEELQQSIRTSYELVYDKLSKRDRLIVDEMLEKDRV